MDEWPCVDRIRRPGKAAGGHPLEIKAIRQDCPLAASSGVHRFNLVSAAGASPGSYPAKDATLPAASQIRTHLLMSELSPQSVAYATSRANSEVR